MALEAPPDVSGVSWTSFTIVACGGRTSGCHVSGRHIFDRMNALAQWKKMVSMSMTRASRGRFPFTIISSKNGASRSSRARPLMRSVSVRPGTR